MQITIKSVGYVAASNALKLLGEGAKAINGPIATWSSRKPYAGFIETGRSSKPQVRKAGPANMFKDGVAATNTQAPAILMAAIPKGSASVGQAKRRIRDIGIAEIRKRTPVRSGALRDSVEVLERLG